MKPRILFFLPQLVPGRGERHALSLRAALSARGYDTRLLIYGAERGADLLALPEAAGATQLGIKSLASPLGWWRTWRALRQCEYDVIVCIDRTPLVVGSVLRLLGATRARIAGILHTMAPVPDDAGAWLFRRAAKSVETVVFVSRNQKRSWQGMGLACDRMPVVMTGIDVARFENVGQHRDVMRRRLGAGPDDIVFGHVGLFRPENDQRQLVDALADVHARGIRGKVVFVGDGPTRDAVAAHARQAGLEGHVVFAGAQQDARPWMAACDAGVSCSLASETSSLAAVEFLAAGVPVVMADVGGASEIVQDGVNGYLYEACSTKDLVMRMALMADPGVREAMARRARPSVSDLTLQRMTDQYADILDQLAEGPAPSGERRLAVS